METIKEIFKIGRGPSSSHTMGPSKACDMFIKENPQADSFKVILYGSLAKTGVGHRTDYAIKQTFKNKPVEIVFDVDKTDLPHPNTLDIYAFLGDKILSKKTVCSIGGGDIRIQGDKETEKIHIYTEKNFSGIEARCVKENISLYEYVEKNEGKEIRDFLFSVWERMKETVEIGLQREDILPGGLEIKRKAKKLLEIGKKMPYGHEKAIYMISAYAYAASEQNASGEMMVTAPTCGASGVLPAVLLFKQEERGFTDEEIISALAIAGIVGNVVKHNASISGAEHGCQAEVGTACVMAAAALAYLKGLSIKHIECAAEIALEHHLGLTCDPVKGLVQIPCIERNAVAALRAVDAVSLAEMLYKDRKISLDTVVLTMRETGKDINCKYRETAEGGLAALFQK